MRAQGAGFNGAETTVHEIDARRNQELAEIELIDGVDGVEYNEGGKGYLLVSSFLTLYTTFV